MDNNIEPEVLMNSVLGKISDVLLNGDGKVIPKSDDHYLAFMSPGIPVLEDTFNYAIEGFGGVERKNADPEKLHEAVGPQAGSNAGNTASPMPTSDDAPVVGAEVESPGVTSAATDAIRKYQSAEAFAALCDLVPDTSGIIDSGRINTWQPEARISHGYAIALQFSQVYNTEPDEETQRKIERWRSLLQTTKVEKDLVTEEEVQVMRESDLVKKYREKMLAYYGEVLAYNNMRISALSGEDEAAVHMFAINGPIMQLKIAAAENDWISNGYRDEYNRINAAIAAVEGRSFALLKQRYKEDFFRSLLTNPSSGANFMYTAPAPADFARSDSGWSEFYFNKGSYKSKHTFTSKTTSGGGGFSLGFIHAMGGGSSTKKKWEGNINTESFSMRFKMARVPIYRAGFNLAFLKSGFWRFDQKNLEYKTTLLSDGADQPQGIMPAITTDCIFVKDLSLDFGEYNSHYQREYSKVSGRAGVSFGPFHLGGSHTNIRDQRTHEADWSSQGLHIKGMQIIGFLCYMLDKCPDPNPNVTDWI